MISISFVAGPPDPQRSALGELGPSKPYYDVHYRLGSTVYDNIVKQRGMKQGTAPLARVARDVLSNHIDSSACINLDREMLIIENEQVKSSAYSDSRRARPKENPTKRKNIDWINEKRRTP